MSDEVLSNADTPPETPPSADGPTPEEISAANLTGNPSVESERTPEEVARSIDPANFASRDSVVQEIVMTRTGRVGDQTREIGAKIATVILEPDVSLNFLKDALGNGYAREKLPG